MLSVNSIQYLSTSASMVLSYRDTPPSVVLSTRMGDYNTDVRYPRLERERRCRRVIGSSGIIIDIYLDLRD